MSKLGPHIISPSSASSRWAAGAPIVKGLDNTNALQVAPANSLRVFRHYFKLQNLGDPLGVAFAILRSLNGYRHSNLFVEIYNEVYQSISELQGYCDFLDTVVSELHSENVKVAAFSFSTGNPSYPAWIYCRSRHFCQSDAIALHEYWGEQGFTLNNALRHRQLWQASDPPIIITECGRDAVEGGKSGWLLDSISPEQYVKELIAYNAELQKDNYILGATPFTSGPTSNWNAFSLDSISDFLLAQLGAAGGAYNGVPNVDEQNTDLANRVAAIEKRHGLIYNILVAIVKGEIEGAAGAKGLLVELNGGKPIDWTSKSPK